MVPKRSKDLLLIPPGTRVLIGIEGDSQGREWEATVTEVRPGAFGFAIGEERYSFPPRAVAAAQDADGQLHLLLRMLLAQEEEARGATLGLSPFPAEKVSASVAECATMFDGAQAGLPPEETRRRAKQAVKAAGKNRAAGRPTP